MIELTEVQAKFIKFIFHNKDNKFSVALFELIDLSEKELIVTGYFNGFEKECIYAIKGKYVEHARYGMQFQAEEVTRVLNDNKEDLISYLSGTLFEGIGRKFATSIVDTLGLDCIELIKENINILDSVPKMNIKRKAALMEGINASQDGLQKSISFFKKHGFNLRSIIKMERKYGSNAINIACQNPYQLIEDIDGVGFLTADKLAMNLSFSMEDQQRLAAALVALVMELCMATGDTYVALDVLPKALIKKAGVDNFDFDSLLELCISKGLLIREEHRIYHHSQHLAEEVISEYFSCFPSEKMDTPSEIEIYTLIEELQMEEKIQYDEIQAQAILNFFKEEVLVCTGGPGTGKTTVVKALVALFRKLYPYYQIACCAPTGRAAKRLAELTGVSCSTIHSLLKWDLETNTFGKNSEDPLVLDCLIIDEFSMVDSWLFSHLLKAGAQIKKICIIGDEDQLPSVACGSVLKDLIASQQFSVTRLQTIFRQQEGSDIVKLAHKIRMLEDTSSSFNGDVGFIACDQYSINNAVMQVVDKALKKGYDIEDIQVLSAKYNGAAGIDRLNTTLQATFNPTDDDKREVKVGHRLFRENDKILQLKNQVDEHVFNGDIGLLVEIIFPEEDINKQLRLIVDFDGILVEYTSDSLQNITHAYCISVHKSQGSEYPIVIMPIAKEASFMLQKRLLYTAITRAKKSLVLIGDMQLWSLAIAKQEEKHRHTSLIERLQAKID